MDRPWLHVLTDPALGGGRSFAEIAEAAFDGGADVVQLRDKTRPPDLLREEAAALVALAHGRGRILVVNDHLELARTVGADGLHLGPDDLPIDEARRRWSGLLGGSARSVARARALEAAGADYLGVGPLYGTTTKPDAPGAIGLERLGAVARAVRIPVVAIGGIDAGNAAAAIRAGAAGVAVVGAVVAATDPRAATAALRAALDSA